jgi:hypothetical protein
VTVRQDHGRVAVAPANPRERADVCTTCVKNTKIKARLRLLILIDNLSNDLVGAVDNAGCRKDAHSAHFRIERHQGENVGFVCVVLERVDK